MEKLKIRMTIKMIIIMTKVIVIMVMVEKKIELN